MEDPVTVVLEHLGVRVEARVSELGNLLGEEFDTVGRVTENDRLVDLQLITMSLVSLGSSRHNRAPNEPWKKGY